MENTEIKLPITGAVVFMKNYLSVGESREIQKIIFSKGEFNMDDPKLSKINPESFLEMQDKAASFLVKNVKESDGSEHAFSIDWLFALPQDDGNLIYDKVNDVINSAALTEESKKK